MSKESLTFKDLPPEEIMALKKRSKEEYIQRLIDIGNRIKGARLLNKLTQQELAYKIGKTESSIRKYEKGIVDIPLGVIEELASALKMSSGDLIYGSEKTKELDMEIDYFEKIVRPKNVKDDITQVLVSMGYAVNQPNIRLAMARGDAIPTQVTIDGDDIALDISIAVYDTLIEEIKDYIQYKLYKLQKEQGQ